MNEEEIRNLFAEMRDEPVPVESLVRVRVLVEERIRRRTPWKIASLVAAFAALVVAAFVVQMRPAVRKHASPPVVAKHRAVAAPVEVAPPQEEEEPVAVRPAIERKVYKPRHDPPPTQSVSIRIETPDPDVVILQVGQ
jgi:hypothetical protein